MQSDSLTLGGKEFQSRFILGSGKYSHELIDSAINEAGAQILTLALRRINESKERNILDFIPKGVTLLPNTSGARNAKEAVRIAQLARELGCGELGCGELVKIEIITDSKFLFPDNAETIKACEALANDGFVPMPYMFPDLNAARAMLSAGASCIMPLAAPIGSNQGLVFKDIIEILINELDTQIIVDAGIGRPSQACEAMEMGAAAIMANTAIASSKNIPLMARAFKEAIIAGRNAYLAGLGAKSKSANASSPLTGFLD
ncbi:thiazole synthase [Campylobacter concisus]